MTERFDPQKLKDTSRRRKEPVELDAGTVWVWEMMASEWVQYQERAMRPAIDPRGGMDPAESMLAEIALSCYDGPEDDAKPIFGDDNLLDIYRLRAQEAMALLAAVNRVNGKTATEDEIRRDFMQATAGASSSR